MRRVLASLLATLFLVAITAAEPVSRGFSSAVSTPKPYQIGRASWYGKQFHGRSTASGEPYDMFQFTAAHRQLPLGTWVRVTNLRNGRSITVRVNDRGPYVGNRIIDLSYGAAQMLELRARGTEKVRIDIVNGEEVTSAMAGR
ncbi:MAG: septal ring lytic transglycosylase RlpA family protein [Acidobacteriota bacterium]|nr:septal ring lytic transglycosylase RlpA family protein [Acidobacteriota bacterium]